MYLEVSASCLAFSSSACRACSTSWFLRSTSWFWWASSRAFSCSSWLVCLQLLLPALQLLGQRLRLLEQVLGPHVGLDRVEHDADALGQLVEEGLVRRIEALERGQLEHALDLALEDDRQHDDVLRRRVAQAGGDADVVGRHVGEQDLLLLQGALADQPLAELELACRRRSGRL